MDEAEQQLNYIENSFLELARKAQSVTPEQAQEFERVVSEKLKPFQKDLVEVAEKVSKVRELLHWIGGAVAFNTNPSILRKGLLDLAPEIDRTWGEAKAAFQRMQATLGVEFPTVAQNGEDLEWLVVQTISGLEAVINGRDNGDILRKVISRNRLAEKPLQARVQLNKGGRPSRSNQVRLEIAQQALQIWIKTPGETRLNIFNQLLKALNDSAEPNALERDMLAYLRDIPYEKRSSRLRKIIYDFRMLNKT